MSQGFVFGFQSWSAWVSVAAEAALMLPWDVQTNQLDSEF
jgi:hypothetical protein